MSPSLNFGLLAVVLCATAGSAFTMMEVGPITDHEIERLPVGTRVVISATNVDLNGNGDAATFKVTDDSGTVVATNDDSSSSGDTYPYLSMSSVANYATGVEASLEFFITSEDLYSPLHVQWPTAFGTYPTTTEAFFYYDDMELPVLVPEIDYFYKLKMGDECLHAQGKRVSVRPCRVTAKLQDVEFSSGTPFLAVSAGDPVKISVGDSGLKAGMNQEWFTAVSKKKKGDQFTLTPLYWTLAGEDEALTKRWTFQILEEKSGECLSFDEEINAMVFLPCVELNIISERIEFNDQAIDLEVVIAPDCRTTGCGSWESCAITWGTSGSFSCQAMVVAGRPFSLPDGTSAFSPLAKEGAGESWCVAPVDEENSSLSSELSTALGARWAEDGLAEHASVASFARFSLELMAVAAPPSLLIASHKAGLDEIHHAQLCFGLADLYNSNSTTGDETESTRYGPGAFPLQLEASESGIAALVSLMTKTALEGCVHETVSTIKASARLAQATEPAVQAALKTIWEDEARHSALAWRTVRWALAQLKVRGSAQELADGVAALEKVFETEIARVVASVEADLESDVPQYGFVSGSALVEVVQEVAESMLRPWSVAVLKTAAVTAPADCTTVVGRAVCAVAAELENAL